MCVCVCMCVYVCSCIGVCVCHLHARQNSVCESDRVCRAYLHIHIYTYTHACIRAYIHACIEIYLQIYIHTLYVNVHKYILYTYCICACMDLGIPRLLPGKRARAQRFRVSITVRLQVSQMCTIDNIMYVIMFIFHT